MAERSTAATLQDKLTEHGLARTLGRQDFSPELVRELTIEEAARVVQRSILGPGPTPKAKKAARKKTAIRCESKEDQEGGNTQDGKFGCAPGPSELLEAGQERTPCVDLHQRR